MPYSLVATGIFAARNSGKTSNGDIGRLPVTVGQTTSIVKAASEYGNPFSKTLKRGLEILGNDKVARGLGKAATWASENINPLLVVSSGIKVGMAKKEDRKKVMIEESGLLGGMFIVEGWMKKNLAKYLEKLPVNKKWLPFIKGVTFVAGSITGSTLGCMGGKKLAKVWDVPVKDLKKSDFITDKDEQKPYEPIDLRA